MTATPLAVLRIVAPHRMADPTPGFWMLRQHRYGAEVPAAILLVHTTCEPGDETNLMDRSPFLAAFIAGKPAQIDRVWRAVKTPISAAHYSWQLARLSHARLWVPDEPMLSPREPVDLIAMSPVRPE